MPTISWTARTVGLPNEFTDEDEDRQSAGFGNNLLLPYPCLDGGGDVEGAWSAENTQDATSATTDGDAAGAPGMPRTLVATPGTDAGELDTVELTWLAPDGADDANITGYTVQRWNSATGMWDEVATPTASEYTDSVTQGSTYYYRVAAVNAHGTGDYYVGSDENGYVAAVVQPATVANAPQMVTATALGPDSIRLSWNEPAPNGATVSGYDCSRYGILKPTLLQLGALIIPISGAGTTMYLHTDLNPNTRYDYRLKTTGSSTVELYWPMRPRISVHRKGRS